MTDATKAVRRRTTRQQRIVEHVVAHGSASVTDLVELTGVSLMTVHRDLDELADRGVVRKFRGGVSAQPSTVFEASSDYRLTVQLEQKEAIARAALELIEPGSSVLLDDSTTALALARHLGKLTPLTVVTNYARTLEALKTVPGVRLICLGGDYSRTHDSYIGMPCLEAIASISVDTVCLSTSAMTSAMTYHQEQDITQIKRAMISRGERRVLLMDSSKSPRRALHQLAPVREFDHLVVDADTDPQLLTELRENTRVIVAKEVHPK
ncbi:MAG TPA: DeoR/GlpR family DNA-binding transcription regulator [Pseudonocardia sp.]|jgi:DeoR/GlpR family transcriptional regulator of sugar metabolism|uniref:DeoR/GlpR family DNA-binding transcription regulator n=1 Tax=Pseudonocardia sp. TaxID=60912 RepID=UPI002F429648